MFAELVDGVNVMNYIACLAVIVFMLLAFDGRPR